MSILKGYAVPHPPIILPELGRGEEKKIQQTIDAMDMVGQEIAELAPHTIIISSPHAPGYRDGFFLANSARVLGSMARFGLPQLEEEVEIDREAVEFIKEIAYPIQVDTPERSSYEMDHAVFVPLYFIHKYYRDFKVVLMGLSGLDGDGHYRMGMAIQEAMASLGRKAVFVASGDLSHVLREDGPYGFRKEGPAFDEKIVGLLKEADFAGLLEIEPEEMDEAAQCGTPSFQIMAGAFDGYDVDAELYSYEGPFGVGYGVLAFEPKDENPDRKFVDGKELS